MTLPLKNLLDCSADEFNVSMGEASFASKNFLYNELKRRLGVLIGGLSNG